MLLLTGSGGAVRAFTTTPQPSSGWETEAQSGEVPQAPLLYHAASALYPLATRTQNPACFLHLHEIHPAAAAGKSDSCRGRFCRARADIMLGLHWTQAALFSLTAEPTLQMGKYRLGEGG